MNFPPFSREHVSIHLGCACSSVRKGVLDLDSTRMLSLILVLVVWLLGNNEDACTRSGDGNMMRYEMERPWRFVAQQKCFRNLGRHGDSLSTAAPTTNFFSPSFSPSILLVQTTTRLSLGRSRNLSQVQIIQVRFWFSCYFILNR